MFSKHFFEVELRCALLLTDIHQDRLYFEENSKHLFETRTWRNGQKKVREDKRGADQRTMSVEHEAQDPRLCPSHTDRLQRQVLPRQN